MARIERVGHVVLYVTDVAKAVEFYRDKLGMEVVRWAERPGAFMSFGRQHHDIGLFTARNDERGSVGAPGLSHVAFVIEGSTEELKATFDDLSGRGVEFTGMIDYGYTRSMYCNDPDGNRIELYCELLEPLAGKRFLATRNGVGKEFKWDEVLESDGNAVPGAPVLHTGSPG
jgi:catechol 2,3-dioxygenase